MGDRTLITMYLPRHVLCASGLQHGSARGVHRNWNPISISGATLKQSASLAAYGVTEAVLQLQDGGCYGKAQVALASRHT